MKLFYSPGACSLACHIALEELNQNYEAIRVNLKNHTLAESGKDYYQINSSGSVPCLLLDDNTLLSQGGAILTYLAENFHDYKNYPALQKARFHEWLFYLNSDVHKSFTPIYGSKRYANSQSAQEEIIQACRKMIENHFHTIERKLTGPYLLGEFFSFADAYLFVLTSWTKSLKIEMEIPKVSAHFERIKQRPTVQRVLQQEGLNI